MTLITSKSLIGLAILLLPMAAMPTQAEASHHPLLCPSAEAYRLSVREFEHHVRRVHYIDQCDVRLVGQLEDIACAFRSAANHPEPLCNFLDLWREVQERHCRVETAIFGRSCYPRNLHLELSWKRVVYFYQILSEQIRCLEAQLGVGPTTPVLQRSVSRLTPLHDRYRTFGSLAPKRYEHQSYAEALAERRRSAMHSAPTYKQEVPSVPGYQHRARPLVPTPNTTVPTPNKIVPKSNLFVPSGRNIVPTSHRVETRDLGSAMIGAMLARLIR